MRTAHSPRWQFDVPIPFVTVTAVIDGHKKPEFGGGQCIELMGTPHVYSLTDALLARAVADGSRLPKEPE